MWSEELNIDEIQLKHNYISYTLSSKSIHVFNIICILSLFIKNWKGLPLIVGSHCGLLISTGGDYSLKLRLLTKIINSSHSYMSTILLNMLKSNFLKLTAEIK